ncbi:MAG: DnaJ domain-containing protein [Candidatus Limnocylindrales bacterium]
MADHYAILQVQPTAHPDVIAAAHRALARRLHPDTGGDERAMMVLNASWDVLRDPDRRAAYDAARRASAAAPPRPVANAAASAAQQAGQPQRAAAHPTARPPGLRGDPMILDFGRCDGHPVAEVARTDPDYLLWLVRTPIGRRDGREVAALLERPEVAPRRPAGRWRR